MHFQIFKQNWILGALVAVFLMIIGLYPQISLRSVRGTDYQGVYAYNDLDETAYAGYLQALIDGRPRRNNPFTGVDDNSDKPLAESLFSIQFLAPYLVAVPARIFGINASTALIWVAAFAALAAALAVYQLALSLTSDSFFAAATTLVVLCCGVLVIGEGAVSEIWFGWAAYPYFPFLRRYVPAVPFPIFWLLCLMIWHLLNNKNIKNRIVYCFFASICFASLVYSYFYLWTTAAAWLVCLSFVWLIFRPLDWRRDVQAFAVLGLLAVLALAPYFLMLANRDTAMDDIQLLVRTRMPDLLRRSEILSLTSLLIIILAGWYGYLSFQNKLTLFVLSLALVPITVFNQQIFTGLVLQPIHYEVFIVNYLALFAFCLTVFLLWRANAPMLPRFSRPLLASVMIIAGIWGGVEAFYTTAVVREANSLRDEANRVNHRLRELAPSDLFGANGARVAVLPFDLLQGDDQPTVTSQSVLWARHQHVFAGETTAENKKRFYHFLYFSDFDGESLRQQLRSNNVVVVISLFGWDRLTSRLSSAATSLTESEIQAEVKRFEDFRTDFDAAEAARLQFKYVVRLTSTSLDLVNLDRWYERESEETIGKYVLYRVKLRQ